MVVADLRDGQVEQPVTATYSHNQQPAGVAVPPVAGTVSAFELGGRLLGTKNEVATVVAFELNGVA